MKVVHLSTTDYGGAYEAAQRISDSMRIAGIESKVIVRTKYRKQTQVEAFFNNNLQRFISKARNVLNLLVSEGDIIIDRYGTSVCTHPAVKAADIICIHWVNSFISTQEVRRITEMGKPVYWIMHDMWPFTGGCHYAGECLQYTNRCEECPRVLKNKKISYWNKLKRVAYQGENLIAIGPSNWISGCATKSSIFAGKKIYTIHNPVDTNIFYPKNNEEIKKLRNSYGLSEKKTTILFGAAKVTNNPIKGFNFFLSAVQKLPEDLYQILVIGESDGWEKLKAFVKLKIIELGFIEGHERLCDVYNMADILIAPSLEENYSNTVLESLSCGTPAVVFDVGGMSDLIIHKENGYLAQKGDADDLYRGIQWVTEHLESARIRAREGILENNTYEVIGQKYRELFEKEI